MNKASLAQKVGVSARIVTAYERGEKEPSGPTLGAIAEVLRVPVSFLGRDEIDAVPADGASFRALSRMTASQRDAALAAGTLCVELERWLSEHFELPAVSIPKLDPAVTDPESAAILIRAQWGLGEKPIANLVHLLEANGVRVFSLAQECREVDAFSFWHEAVPFVCLNTMKSAEHGLFDAAHELGHLVLHRGHESPRGRQQEQEAQAFASNFLMPRIDVLGRAPRFPSFQDLIGAKKRWRVSVAALNYRLHRLGVISDWHYRELCVEIARFGRNKEPQPMQREQSQLLAKAFATLREEGIGRSEVAAALDIYASDLDALVFGLVMSSVEGGGELTKDKRPALRVVRPHDE